MENNAKKKLKIRFKNKKAAITAVGLAVVALLIICLCIWGIVKLATKEDKEVITELHPDFTVTVLSGSMDSTPNTLSYIKNAASCGASIIEADLMFNTKGEPVLTDSFDNIDADTTVPLTKALDVLKNHPEVGIMLDLHAVTNLPRIEELAEKYNMFSRIYYSGVTMENYEYVESKSPNIPIFLELDLSDVKADNHEYYDYMRDFAYNAYAVNVDFDQLDADWAELLLLESHRVSVYNLSSNRDFSKALEMGVANIITDEPGELQSFARDWLISNYNEKS